MPIKEKAQKYAQLLLNHRFASEESLIEQIGRIAGNDRLLVPTEEQRPRTHPLASPDGGNSYPFKYYLGGIRIEFVVLTNIDYARSNNDPNPFVEIHPVYVWDDGKEYWWGMYQPSEALETVVCESFDKMISHLNASHG